MSVTDEEPCWFCDGEGRVQCPDCSDDASSQGCERCDGTDSVECPECLGSGVSVGGLGAIGREFLDPSEGN